MPSGVTVRYDELALYPRALDAATIAAHFAASGNAKPAAPANLSATTANNQLTLKWDAPAAGAPAGERAVDHYLVEAPGAAQFVAGDQTAATLSGLPAGTTHVTIRAFNGFGEGPAGTLDVDVPGAATTYASLVNAEHPALFWRMSEKSGTAAADASGHGLTGSYADDAASVTHAGALAGDPDHGIFNQYEYYEHDMLSAPSAAGLPTGDRTVEGWVIASGPGAQLIGYGDFTVTLDTRALVVAGQRFDAGSVITNNTWHHVAVTYAGTTLSAYLDGVKLGSATVELATEDTGPLTAAHSAYEATSGFDDLAVYDHALDAPAIAAHFAASGNGKPDAPGSLRATGTTLTWTPQTGGRAPKSYVAEAWQGTTLRAAQAADGGVTTATLSGLPAGVYTFKLRATNGYGTSEATTAGTVGGSATTYAGLVTSDAPTAYWRLGERSGTLAADASGNGHTATFASPTLQHTVAGAIAGDADHGITATASWTPVDLLQADHIDGVARSRPSSGPTAPAGRSPPTSASRTARSSPAASASRSPTTTPAASPTASGITSRSRPARGTLTLYLDGEPVATAPGALSTPDGDLFAAEVPSYGQGAYDDIAIYPRALSTAQIAAHFAASGLPYPNDKTAPAPTIDDPGTTSTRPKLHGRLGTAAGDLQTASVRIYKGSDLLLVRDVDGTNWSWDVGAVLPVGNLTVEVHQKDSSGNEGTATRAFTVTNAAPATPTLALDKTDGALPLNVRATVAGSDPDGDPLTFHLDFGDDGWVDGVLPVPPVAHVYTRAGTHTVKLTVSDGTVETTTSTTVTTRLAEPLKADAGDDQIVEAGTPLTFDASASRPAIGIERYHWTFSDGGSDDGAIVSHTFTTAGDRTATLTIGAGTDTSTATAHVKVLPQAPAVIARVLNNGQPLGGADVLAILADGRRISATTKADGTARLAGLPDGAQTIYAYAPGMRPGSAETTVSGGAGSADISLVAGEVASATLESHPMTPQEVAAAGIDPNAPGNQQVYSFDAQILVAGQTLSLSGSLSENGIYGCGAGAQSGCLVCSGGGGGGTGGGGGSAPSYAYAYPSFQNGVPLLQWLILPARIGFLKEFFQVSMVVQNLAGPEFTLKDGSAAIDLPPGLSLAPTTTPQQQTVALPDIKGGADAKTSWIVRGDTEGDYYPHARYFGTLDPIGLPVSLDARLTDPLHVYGASAMKLVVDADDRFDKGNPGHVRVGIKNVSPVAISNVSLQLPAAGEKNFVAQPQQRREWTAASIAPGDTWFPDAAGDPDDDFIIAPNAQGTVDLSRSFVSQAAGEQTDSAELRTHAQVQPVEQDAAAAGLQARRLDRALVGEVRRRRLPGLRRARRQHRLRLGSAGHGRSREPGRRHPHDGPAGHAAGARSTPGNVKEIAVSTVKGGRLVLLPPDRRRGRQQRRGAGAGDRQPPGVLRGRRREPAGVGL